MQSFIVIMAAISGFCAGSCIVLVIFMGRLWRQVHLYQALLALIVRDAWMARHMPIWIAWSETTGIRFQVVIDDR